jgi:putative chitinase
MLEKLQNKLPTSIVAELQSVQIFTDTPTPLRLLNTPLRLAHFLAQTHYESGGFNYIEENLNYSAKRLMEVFPKQFKNINPHDYAHDPERIANHVYANRMGNGNEASGDGYKYRGRGYLQLTGRKNYEQFFICAGLQPHSNPDLVANSCALASAAWFFDTNQLWKWCDVGSSDRAVLNVAMRVSDGTHGINGIKRRIELFNFYYGLLQ